MPLRPDMVVPPPNPLPTLAGVPVHLLGIRGRGMTPLALAARLAGADVDGCDRSPGVSPNPAADPLGRAGIVIADEHDPAHVHDRHLVVTSMARPDLPEVAAAAETGRLHHRTELLNAVTIGRSPIAVTGSHGKGTVAALAGCALAASGADPLVVIGVPVARFGGSFRAGAGPAVIEADDADGSIARVSAHISVVTNSWSDHPMLGRTRREVLDDVVRHVAGVPPTGHVVVGRSRSVDAAARAARAPVWRLGRDLEVETLEVHEQGRVLRLHDPVESTSVTARVAIHGGDIADNAALAFAALRAHGLTPTEAAGALGALDGLDRRLELVGTERDVRVFDDLGKHPAALKANLSALRALDGQRIHVLYEPSLHVDVLRWGRRWADALGAADTAVVLPMNYTASLPVQRRAPADWPMRVGSTADVVDARDAAVDLVADRCGPGDIVLVCGVADDLRLLARALLARLGAAS